MTESEWLTSTDPQSMLELLQSSGKASDRKLRLFAVSCCRRIWAFLLDSRSRESLEVSERYADGLANREQLARAWEAAMAAARVLGHPPAYAVASVTSSGDPSSTTSSTAARAAGPSGIPPWEVRATAEFQAERAIQANLLRDIFSNPFQPPPVRDPTWLTWNNGLVQRLAQVAYDDRLLPSGLLDPTHLAVLSDALLDAGCSADHELLAHLRGPGPHVRGCWAVDCLTARG
jgi:hypothetical protein